MPNTQRQRRYRQPYPVVAVAGELFSDTEHRTARANHLGLRQGATTLLEKSGKINSAKPTKRLERVRLLHKHPPWQKPSAKVITLPSPWDVASIDGIQVRMVTDPDVKKKMEREQESWWNSKGAKSFSVRPKVGQRGEQSALYRSINSRRPGPLARLSEKELIIRLAANNKDKEAIKEFNSRLFPLVYRHLVEKGRARNAEDAEEITQMTVVEAIRGVKKLTRKSRIVTWAYKIADNNAKDYYRPRNAKRRPRKLDALFVDPVEYVEELGSRSIGEFDGESEGGGVALKVICEDDDANATGTDKNYIPTSPGHAGPDPLTRLLIRERQKQIKVHLAKLPEHYQEIIQCRFYEGVVIGERFRWRLPLKDAAERLGLSSVQAADKLRRRAIGKLSTLLFDEPYFDDRHLSLSPTCASLTEERVIERMSEKRLKTYRTTLRAIG